MAFNLESMMKKQVVSFAPLQAGKVMAAVYFVCSLPILVLMLVPALSGSQQMPMFFIILMPFLYAFFGFLFSLLGAWIYNIIAARIGGLEYTTVEVGSHF